MVSPREFREYQREAHRGDRQAANWKTGVSSIRTGLAWPQTIVWILSTVSGSNSLSPVRRETRGDVLDDEEPFSFLESVCHPLVAELLV